MLEITCVTSFNDIPKDPQFFDSNSIFLTPSFLESLEASASVGHKTGWLPFYLIALQNKKLVGFMPIYIKEHSYGEYVFDWAWADAFHRNGLNYYPKLLCAVPFIAPSIMGTFAQPAQTLAQVGAAETARAQQPITEAMQRFAFEQQAPSQALQQYGNIVAGTILPGTVTSTAPGPQGPGMVAGALGGAGIGSLFAPAGAGLMNPYVLGGALLGGLLG